MEAINRYTADSLRSFNSDALRPPRSVRKILFSYQLWNPARTRRRTRRLVARGLPRRTESGSHDNGSVMNIQVGTMNVRSINNKYSDVAELIIAGDLDFVRRCGDVASLGPGCRNTSCGPQRIFFFGKSQTWFGSSDD